jgi:hypothetical protein
MGVFLGTMCRVDAMRGRGALDDVQRVVYDVLGDLKRQAHVVADAVRNQGRRKMQTQKQRLPTLVQTTVFCT